MNLTILNGKLITEPKVSIFKMKDNKEIYACKFVIGVADDTVEEKDAAEKADYFECIAFEQAARKVINFSKGSQIIISGKMKNFSFEDINKTAHYTDIVLVEKAEYGDTESILARKGGEKRGELPILSDLKKMEHMFWEICNHGFLCIDEDNYYNIATANVSII